MRSRARVGDQLAFLLTDIEVRAVKIGMIGSSAIARRSRARSTLTAAPVVWDPVLRPSRGDVALVDGLFGDAVAALRPHLTALITPNAGELAFLTGTPVADLDDARDRRPRARRRGSHRGAGQGRPPRRRRVDRRAVSAPGGVDELRGPRIADGEHVHGTGCALSSAIAAHLAPGRSCVDACRAAKEFVAERIARAGAPGPRRAAVV